MFLRKFRHHDAHYPAGGRRVACSLATVREKEIELAEQRVRGAVEMRWSRRIQRASLLRRLILLRLKRRAIVRAIARLQ